MRHIVTVTVVYDDDSTGGGAVIHCTPDLETNILSDTLRRMCDAGGLSHKGQLPRVHALPTEADDEANYEENTK